MFEIRNYHYDPTKFEAYKEWAINDAVPYLKANLDIVGFWIDNGIEPELLGADPDANKHGSANVTWVIRWDSKEARDQGHQRHHPIGDAHDLELRRLAVQRPVKLRKRPRVVRQHRGDHSASVGKNLGAIPVGDNAVANH